MQPTVSSFLTPLALKTAGAVLILSSLIDLIFMLWLPPENLILEGDRWWLYATSQLVDRGLLPLVGISFVVAGDWIRIVSTEDGGDRGNAWRIGTFGLASLLGLIFVLIIPFQLMTTNDIKAQDLKKIDAEVAQVEKNINGNLQQIKSQSKEKIKEQIATIDKEIATGKSQGEQLAQLQVTKTKLELLLSDPKKFDEESQKNLKQFQKQRQTVEAQVNKRMLQTGVRTSLASLLLAIAYITIGWAGLRRVLK
jgi:ABC-type multidrug transport system fused ATPase/permease subunit